MNTTSHATPHTLPTVSVPTNAMASAPDVTEALHRVSAVVARAMFRAAMNRARMAAGEVVQQ